MRELSDATQQLQEKIYFPYEVSFPDSDTSPATIMDIQDHLAKLSKYYDRIIDCKIKVRIPHKHRALRFFHVHLELTVPGKKFIVSKEPETNETHSSVRNAIHDAFVKLTHQLQNWTHS